ncbi:hypothetical protein GBAR_LOCUS10123 [Geodia barretti]|uniref:Uncharacterized protein n=1 Tax=Geodia barretti TaxID=519541 RepID=A0AA35WJB4_GEOBA|nr:hypothetical protein GBAR_LOCUS10123 [Geodia barretti]
MQSLNSLGSKASSRKKSTHRLYLKQLLNAPPPEQMGSMVFQVRQKQRMEGQPQTCHIF